jgi:hypothetical protein
MRFDFNESALQEIADSAGMADMLDQVGRKVRTQARRNARAIYPAHGEGDAVGAKKTPIERGVIAAPGRDAEGRYVDVGYHHGHAGFVLFWTEVGTTQMSPRPHLRPAVEQVRF